MNIRLKLDEPAMANPVPLSERAPVPPSNPQLCLWNEIFTTKTDDLRKKWWGILCHFAPGGPVACIDSYCSGLEFIIMLAILKDAETRPDLFFWFGPIERAQVEMWIRSSNLEVPSDLLDFWIQTGGGDFFDAETMFRPTLIPTAALYFVPGDDISAANEWRIRNGMTKSYLAFHDGLFLSAVRLADQKIVTLSDDHRETAEFSHLDDWYLGTFRELYGALYGLAP
jgi:hypothetical protein